MTLSDQIVESCKTPAGLTASEAANALGDDTHKITSLIWSLIRKGRLFKSGVHRHYRYFTSKEDADAWNLIAEDAYKAARLAVKQRQKEARRTGNPPGRPSDQKTKPKPKPVPIVLRSAGKSKKMDKIKSQNANVTWPDHVKVQFAPQHKDSRFSFDPPPGWKGQITQDWMDRRLQEVGQ